MGSPLDLDPLEPQQLMVDVDGVMLPVEEIAVAVSRCVKAIQAINLLLREQGFATESDLQKVRTILTGQEGDNASNSD